MLSDQENFRLAEIERHLMLSDPSFVRRMMRRRMKHEASRSGRFFRWLFAS